MIDSWGTNVQCFRLKIVHTPICINLFPNSKEDLRERYLPKNTS